MLKTRWTDSVDLSQPLNEYPRPQFVRDSYFSLNGKWQYKITKSPAIPDDYDGEIVVPFSPESELSGVNRTVGPNDYLIYKKTFVLPSDFNKGRVYINFNILCLGKHRNCYGRGMNSARALGFGNSLYTVHAAFILKAGICALALNHKADFLTAAKLGFVKVYYINLKVLCLGIH